MAETGKHGTGLAIAPGAEAAAATAPPTALLAPRTASLGSGEQAVARKQAGEQQSVLLGPSGGVGSPAVAGAVAFLGAAVEWFDNAVAALGGGFVGSMDVVLWWGNHLNGSRRGGAKRSNSRHNGVVMQLGGHIGNMR